MKYVQYHNAGENLALEHASRKGLEYIFSTLHEEHINKMAELKKIAFVFGRVQAMLKGGGFDKFWHHGFVGQGTWLYQVRQSVWGRECRALQPHFLNHENC